MMGKVRFLALGAFLAIGFPVWAQTKTNLKLDPNGVLRHPSAVRAIAIAPDSSTAYVGLNDGALLAYTLENRKPIPVPFRTFSPINGLAINSQGDRLAVIDDVGWVTLLDPATFKTIKSVRLKNDPERMVFTPDGQSIFLGMSNGHVLKLKTEDLTTEKDIFPTEGSRVLALACSPDGQNLATSDREGQIKLWSTADLTPQKTWKAHKVFARSLAFDPTGQLLVSGGEDAVLKVWKLADFSLLKESKEYHQLSIECLAFAPQGGPLISGGYDGLCQFWDAKTFAGGRSFPNYRGYITSAAVSPNGRWLVRGGTSLDIVPLNQPEEFTRLADYGGAILAFAVASDMKRMVSGGLDRRLTLWQIDKGIVAKSVLVDDWITGLEFVRDGQAIALSLANGRLEIRDAATLEREHVWQAHQGRITGLARVQDFLVSVGEDGATHLWDKNGKKHRSYDEIAPGRSVAVRDKKFAVGTANGLITVYDLEQEAPWQRLRGRPMSVTALEFSGGGTRLMAGYFDGGLESISVETWKVVHHRPGSGGSVLSIAANMKSDWVAVGYRDGIVRVLDVVDLREAGAAEPKPSREVFAVRWVLNETSLAAAGAGNALAFFNIKSDVGGPVLLDVQDRLAVGGVRDRVRKDSFAKVFEIKLEQGTTYVIDLMSKDLDPFLRLENPAGQQLAEDDDGGEGFNARLVFTPPAAGTYRLIATTYAGNAVGGFQIKVSRK